MTDVNQNIGAQPQTIGLQHAMQLTLNQQGDIMKQLDILTIKVQAIQNALISKNILIDDDIREAWDKIISEIKNVTKTNLVSPTGRPVTAGAPDTIIPTEATPADSSDKPTEVTTEHKTV